MQQISWMASSQWPANVAIVLGDELFDSVRPPGYIAAFARTLEQIHKLLDRRVSNVDLERNTSQKGFVYKLFGLQVGRKENSLLKRNREFLSSRQAKEIVPAFEWNDPSIQKLRWSHPLATEVVDQ